MKKSELKALIREVVEEISDTDPLAQKFFLAAYNHIKKNGQKKTRQNMLPAPQGGGWASDTWTLGDVKVSDLNQHFSRAVYSPSVSVMMDRRGKMIWQKGSLDDLKELLVSISEQKMEEGWKDTAKAVGAAGAIAGAAALGIHADKTAPRVEIGGQICYVVPEDHGKVPSNAQVLKGKDGKMYKVWKANKSGQYFAFPTDK